MKQDFQWTGHTGKKTMNISAKDLQLNTKGIFLLYTSPHMKRKCIPLWG